MPNVLLEAMASRLPVVAADVEGVRELLGPEADRQTVAFGDSEGLAVKICAMLRDPETAAQFGQSNLTRVMKEFSIQKTVDRYQQLWQSLVGQEKNFHST
jgi:glycosyltransferase involved in cell wall biosynthesis